MPSTKRLNGIKAKTFGSRCRHMFSRFFLSWNLRSRCRHRKNDDQTVISWRTGGLKADSAATRGQKRSSLWVGAGYTDVQVPLPLGTIECGGASGLGLLGNCGTPSPLQFVMKLT